MAYEKQKRVIDAPVVSEFKGFGTLSIPFGKDKEAWTFGYQKAKAIMTYYADIAKFVAEQEAKFSKGGN